MRKRIVGFCLALCSLAASAQLITTPYTKDFINTTTNAQQGRGKLGVGEWTTNANAPSGSGIAQSAGSGTNTMLTTITVWGDQNRTNQFNFTAGGLLLSNANGTLSYSNGNVNASGSYYGDASKLTGLSQAQVVNAKGLTNNSTAWVYVSQAVPGVDSNTGSDPSHPVLTLSNAQSIAFTQGKNVWVMDGVYTNGNLGTNGVSWYFEKGTRWASNTISAMMFYLPFCTNTAGDASLTILGHLSIENQMFSLDATANGIGPIRIYCEADNIDTTNAAVRNICQTGGNQPTNGVIMTFLVKSNFYVQSDFDNQSLQQCPTNILRIYAENVWYKTAATTGNSSNNIVDITAQSYVQLNSITPQPATYILRGGIWTHPAVFTFTGDRFINFKGTQIQTNTTMPPDANWYGNCVLNNGVGISKGKGTLPLVVGGSAGSGGLIITNGPIVATNNVVIAQNGFLGPFVSSTKTANYTVLASDFATRFDNNGAGGAVTNTLPAATVGLHYGFTVVTAQFLTILANGTDTIQDAGSASSAGGGFFSNTVGNQLHVYCPVAGKWFADYAVGSWTSQ